MIAGLVRLVSVLEQIQSVWNMFAGAVVDDTKLTGTNIFALGDRVEWFQNTWSPYSVIQPVATAEQSKPIGRIGSTYYKSNKTWGNGQIYTSVSITSDWIYGGKNYKGETIYVRSSDAGVPQSTKPASGAGNTGLYILGALAGAYFLFGNNKK
jgi:hypothetical protein